MLFLTLIASLLLAWPSASDSQVAECVGSSDACVLEDSDMGLQDAAVSLMQMSLSTKPAKHRDERAVKSPMLVDHHETQQNCAVLGNRGSWFSVDVGIGSPPQVFALVADTGSDAIIAPDCVCLATGGCKHLDACYNKTNSASLMVDMKPVKGHPEAFTVKGETFSYGSGDIDVVVASEMVKVADTQAWMKKGVYLMENRKKLRVANDFEGILGLGVAKSQFETLAGKASGHDVPPLFAQASGISKYTLCFSEANGALRLGVPHLPNPMSNLGKAHWGLDLQGMAVGDASAPAIFCSPASKKQGMDTACGAIPDSGTTLMMGPKDQIHNLYVSLCDSWPRCKGFAAKSNVSRAKAFQNLLEDCQSWMHEGSGLDELPDIHISMAGSEGVPQKFALNPKSYVLETNQEIFKVVTGKIFGWIPIKGVVDTGRQKRICMPAFGAQEYDTVKNGPVWILGSPLFFQLTVGYDLSGHGAISLEDKPCHTCKEPGSLISSEGAASTASSTESSGRMLRRLDEFPRAPVIDFGQPL